MPLYFITSNAGKFEEAKGILPNLKQLAIDLPEIQELDPKVIIKAKLESAFSHNEGPFVIEDTSFALDCLGGLPGPLIKWFEQVIGNQGLFELASRYQNYAASVTTTLGLAKNRNDISFYSSIKHGTIVAPRGDIGFGWNPIFQPEGFNTTFAEMTIQEKNQLSMRAEAFRQLSAALTT